MRACFAALDRLAERGPAYTCPAGEHLTKGKVRSDRRDNIDHYRNLTACLTCALKPRCTPDKLKPGDAGAAAEAPAGVQLN